MAKQVTRVVFRDHPKSKVFLSPVEKGDVDRYYRWVNDPEVSRYLGALRFPMTHAQEEAWCAGRSEPKTPETNVVAAIIDKKDGTHLGSIGLHNISWTSRCAVTGALIGDKRYWGKGYGSHAKLLLLKYAFDDLGLHSIESRVFSFNGRSARYNLKCGYREVGRLKDHTWADGRYHDELIMQTLPELFAPVWARFEKGRFDRTKPRT